MSKKQNMISAAAFEKAVGNEDLCAADFEWNGLNITVKKFLSLKEFVQFVKICTDACINQNTNAYVPEAKDIAIKSLAVQFYTNITLPENMEKQYDLICRSHIFDEILRFADSEQFGVLTGVIDEKIAYLVKANAAAAEKKVNDICGELSALRKQFEAVFGGVSWDGIKNLTAALSETQMSDDVSANAAVKPGTEK